MADIGDMAGEVNEIAMENAIAYHRVAVESGVPRTGKCHWCEEELVDQRGVFCDGDCRDDYERSRR